MPDVLSQEISGVAIVARIRGVDRVLAYPMHAIVLYKQLTGDSLFVPANFQKIDLATDPDRWLKCLWAGLHELQPDKKSWKAPFTLEEMGALVDFSNAGEISVQMTRALVQSLPKPKDADPKVAPPGELEGMPTNQPSIGSMLDRADDSVLAATNS